MTKELTIHNEIDFTKQLAEFEKIQDTCKKLLQTKHYQKLGEEGIHAIIAKCKALGVHPFEGLNSGFFVVQGRVGMSTEMMAALVRRRGHSVQKDPKSNHECVILHGKRCDNGDQWTCSFSKADAEAAGLWNTATWKKYSQIMLYNRCMSMLFRQLFPDLSLGAGYVEDEIHEITRTGDYKHHRSEDEIDIHPEPLKQIEQKQTISKEQAVEIENILSDCDPEYIPTFHKKMIDIFHAASIADIRTESYTQIRDCLLTRRERYFARQKAEYEAQQAQMSEVEG
jgi:hypothetical protein